MKFEKPINIGIVVCTPKLIEDNRGFFMESFKKEDFEQFLGEKINFCQENTSESKYGVLRGLHFQKHPFSQSKLINVQKGKILDICVDLRKNSKFYGKYFSIILDDIDNKSIFIPKGFAHGFVVLSKSARVSYKVDNYYSPKHESGLNYNDSELNIDWLIDRKSIKLSDKDINYENFNSEDYFI